MTRREGFNRRVENIKFSNKFNAGLWLDKFIYDSRKADPNKPETKNYGKIQASSDPSKKDETAKAELVRQVTAISESEIYKTYFENIWYPNLDAFGADCRKAKVKNRLSINLGSESVLETNISLHKIFGVPFIAGSALKGMVSHFVHQYGGSDWKIGSDKHIIVFGNQDNAGFVTFYDALYIPNTGFPDKNNIRRPLYTDVMTTHHENYYGEKKENNQLLPPADWDSPNPVPFISATGEFLFALSGPNDWVELTFEILSYALEYEGVGAKTSSGYGRFGKLTPYKKSEVTTTPEILSEPERVIETVEAVDEKIETPPQLSDEERKNGRLQWIQQKLDEIVTLDKEKFKEVIKKVKKLDEPFKKEYANLVIKKAESILPANDPMLVNAVWIIEAKEMAK